GLLPVFVLPPTLRAARVLIGAAGGETSTSSSVAEVFDGTAARTVTVLALGLTIALLAGMVAHHAVGRRRARKSEAVRWSSTWGCGYDKPTARMQYTASSFASPILAFFQPITGLRTHRSTSLLETHATDPVLHGFVRPIWRAFRNLTGRARPILRSRLSTNLLYVVAALLTLLAYLVLEGRTS
ncbi:MAG TPA: hypothetical protein VFC35_03395, partial [Gemmatimonadaceae bacterium]|nr:hypothetical protein [Gemmatimonadaceae bacterium]